MAEERLGASFTIDVTQLQAGLKTANAMIRESESEFKAAAAGMDDWSKSEAGLTAKINSLTNIIGVQREKVRAMKDSYQKLIDDGLDPASDRAVKLRTQINKEEAALASNEKELKKNTTALDKLGNESAQTSGEVSKLASESKKASGEVSKLGNESENAGGKLAGLGSIAKTAGAAVGAAMAAAGAAIVGIGKQAIEGYAEFEQLSGGVDKLFGDAASAVKNNAAVAFKTAGMSANDYMQNVTAFSASLISGLGGDTKKAAEIADIAMRDMADNANTFGTDINSIVETYQSLAKGNVQMLDNLKLGYGGTQKELARLINDSGVLGDTIVDEKTVMQVAFSDMILAINETQKRMNITGTTAKEAASTIQGSVGMMQSAWQNLVTGLADETADLDALITHFIESISAVLKNVLPRVSVVTEGIIKLFEELLPEIPPLIEQMLPVLVNGVTTLTKGIVKILPQVVEAIMQVVPQLLKALIGMLPTLMKTLVTIIAQVINALSEMLPTIVNAIMQVLPLLTTALIEAIPQLLQAAITFLMAIVQAIPTIIDALLAALPSIIDTVVNTLIENMPMVVQGALQLFMGIINAIPQFLTSLTTHLPEIIDSIVNGLIEGIPTLIECGGQLLAGLIEGLLNPETIWNAVKGLFNGIVGGFKKIFGIASPSKVMENVVGKNLALGIGEGFEKNIGAVNDEIARSLRLDDLNVNVNRGASGAGGRSVVVNQYNTYAAAHSRYELYKSKQQTAAAVRLALGTV